VGNVRSAYEGTVSALPVEPEDAAAVALGRTLADAIDAAEFLEGESRTKALYLAPHLMNVLKELLATPAARKAAGAVVKEAVSGTLGNLQDQARKRRERSA